MRNDAYWANRMKLLEESLLNRDYEYVENIERQYETAIHEIENQIRSWYQRFAEDNNITLTEAQRLLNTRELKEFRWTVEEYIKYGQENAVSDEWIKQLKNASARVHVSRLDSIKLQLQQQAEVLYGNQLDAIDEAIRRTYSESYYHTAFEIQRGMGVGWSLHSIDEKSIEKVLSRPWTLDKQTFSDRIWSSKQSLVSTVNTQLTQMIMRGTAPDKAIKTISERFKVSKSQAGRLVMTESAAFANEARKDCFRELDVEQYVIVGTLDKDTCSLCGALDSKVYKMSEYQTGITAPPFHPWCRCTTAPFFADMENIGNRAARDKDGNYYEVPRNMSYEDWRLNFVSDAISDGDRAIYERYRKVLRDLSPKSIEDFVNAKYNDSEKWKELKYQYRTLNRYEVIGDVTAKKIIELDNAAFYTKKKGFDYSDFSGEIRDEIKKLPGSGNGAAMDFNGIIYFSHSAIEYPWTSEYKAYRGKYPLVGLKEKRIFTVKDLGDGVPREYDTEAKFLEFVAEKKETEDVFTVTILSEKHICESCVGVVRQFEERFPNATVNIISGKEGYNGNKDGLKTWRYRKKVK